jgi:hypothetical protein
MIQHWEKATGKTVTDPELKKLTELCKKKNLFHHLGFNPLIEQKNSIIEWLCQAKEDEVFKKTVEAEIKDLKGKEKKRIFLAKLLLIRYKTDIVHFLTLKVIQLLDEMSEDDNKSRNFLNGNFHDIDSKIFTIINQDPEVIKLFKNLEASKNLEDDIASLMLKTSAESSSKMFWVKDCPKCGYKFDPKN